MESVLVVVYKYEPLYGETSVPTADRLRHHGLQLQSFNHLPLHLPAPRAPLSHLPTPLTVQPATMSNPTQYLLLSLPTSIVPSHHRDDALDAVQSTVSPDNGSVAAFPIPEFKIGTLDALVSQADELAKLEGQCQGVVGKVGDALRNILEGDEAQIERMKVVNDSMLFVFSRDGRLVGPCTDLCRAG